MVDSPPANPSQWQRTLLLMAVAQGIMSIAVSVSWPFLPLYVIELGVARARDASFWAGTIASVQFLLAAVMSPLWGTVADRVGRKAMVLRTSLSLALFTLLMAGVHDVYQLFGLSALYGFFSGFAASAIALVATTVPEERLGFSLGWMSTAQLAGTLVGPLVGGLLADSLHSYRAVYVCSSLAGLIAAAMVKLAVTEPARPALRRSGEKKKGATFAALAGIVRHPRLAPMFLVLLLAQASAVAVQPIIAPFVHTLIADSRWIATAAGFAIAVTGLADLLASPLLGRRSDRIGYRRVLLISIAGAAAFTLPQAFVRSIWAFLALRFGVGIFLGGILPTANAWIGRLFPREQRGQVYGLTASASSLGLFFGPLLSGVVASRFGFAVVFELVGALMLCNLLWVAFGTRETRLSGAPSHAAPLQ